MKSAIRLRKVYHIFPTFIKSSAHFSQDYLLKKANKLHAYTIKVLIGLMGILPDEPVSCPVKLRFFALLWETFRFAPDGKRDT